MSNAVTAQWTPLALVFGSSWSHQKWIHNSVSWSCLTWQTVFTSRLHKSPINFYFRSIYSTLLWPSAVLERNVLCNFFRCVYSVALFISESVSVVRRAWSWFISKKKRFSGELFKRCSALKFIDRLINHNLFRKRLREIFPRLNSAVRKFATCLLQPTWRQHIGESWQIGGVPYGNFQLHSVESTTFNYPTFQTFELICKKVWREILFAQLSLRLSAC